MSRLSCLDVDRRVQSIRKILLTIVIGLLLSCPSWPSDRPTIEDIRNQDWFLNNLYEQGPHLCCLQIDQDGWHVNSIHLQARLKRPAASVGRELVIPLFPTVYAPTHLDKGYYDAILNSTIDRGDKVLVIGTGSGSDAWAAWNMCYSMIYTIDINPMAIANTYATADLGGFRVRQVLGDIRSIELPKDFTDFDFVLWNMPYLEWDYELQSDYHDGDDGTIIEGFLALLPSLLKEEGQAIIMNTEAALQYIELPYVVVEQRKGQPPVFLISNDK